MPTQALAQNRLLRLMTAEAFAPILPALTRRRLRRGHVVADADETISEVIFPETAVGSVIAVSPGGRKVEAGLFGLDGFAPIDLVLGSDRSSHRVVIRPCDR